VAEESKSRVNSGGEEQIVCEQWWGRADRASIGGGGSATFVAEAVRCASAGEGDHDRRRREWQRRRL